MSRPIPERYQHLRTFAFGDSSELAGGGVWDGGLERGNYGAVIMTDLPLRCRCGRVRGVARAVSPTAGFRFVCYCKDCQAFAHFLERPEILDPAGGTDIFQMPPAQVTLAAGKEALRCLSLSSKVLRWYAECCRTPIANTASDSRFPMVALIHPFMDCAAARRTRDELLGPPLCRLYERSAIEPLPTNAPPSPSLRVFAHRITKLVGWWMRGLARPNAFFDERTKTPLSAPQRLS